jgi:hypothetical protein
MLVRHSLNETIMPNSAPDIETKAVVVYGTVEPGLVSPADPFIARLVEDRDVTYRVILARQALRQAPATFLRTSIWQGGRLRSS